MPKLKIVMGQLPFQLARKEGHAKVLLQLSLRHLLKHWSRLQEAPPCEEGLPGVPMIDGSAGDRDEAQLKADLERVWLQIDERGKGIIDSSKLGELANALGQSMTTKEVQEMTRALCHGDNQGKGHILQLLFLLVLRIKILYNKIFQYVMIHTSAV